MADQEQPDWLDLPSDLLRLIGQRSRDAITGLAAFRSVCRAWRAAVGPAPRLLPNPIGYGFFDFAYHDGRMFGLGTNGEMAVYDAATLNALHSVQPPPATPNRANKIYGFRTGLEEFDYLHLVALPSKLVLVRTSVKSSRPVALNIFELGSTPDGLAWLKVVDAGNYELFLDGYHTTFRENGTNNRTRIYYVHDEHWPKVSSTTAAYCYDMQDNKLECVYRSLEDSPECSAKPS